MFSKRPLQWLFIAECLLFVSQTYQLYGHRFAPYGSAPYYALPSALGIVAVAAYGISALALFGLRRGSMRLRHALWTMCMIGGAAILSLLAQLATSGGGGRIALTSPTALRFLYHYCLLMGLAELAAAREQSDLSRRLSQGFFIYLFPRLILGNALGVGMMLLWEKLSLAAQGGDTVLLLADVANIPLLLAELYLLYLLLSATRALDIPSEPTPL